jgi:simple sugar transport system ATP-binding protein
VDLLLGVVKRLSDSGIGIIYISHRMDEIDRLASSITVMRDGHVVGELDAGKATPQGIVDLMVGAETGKDPLDAVATTPGDVALSVEGLAVASVTNATFEIRAGEVLGLAGLLGSGRTEILRAIVGAQSSSAGTVTLDGKMLTRRSIRSTRNAGIVLTPENRRAEGTVVGLGVDENLVMARWSRVARAGVISSSLMREVVDASIKTLGIKTARRDVPVATLSGGNQQKVVIRKLAASGIGVLVVSSETEELLEVCDRVLVLRGGEIHEDFVIADVTRDLLFDLITRTDNS